MNKKEKSQVDKLVGLAKDNVNFFHDQFGEPYGQIKIKKHLECYPLRKKQFRRHLAKLYYDEYDKTPNASTISSALNLLEALATIDGPRLSLYNRVAWEQEGILMYDLSNAEWQTVQITKDGWEIVKNHPTVLFRRYNHQQAQVKPQLKGDLKDFLPLINIKSEEDKQLILVIMVASLIPDIPHPILICYGPQGSAKSMLYSMMRSLIDPSVTLILTFPKDKAELIQKLSHNWCSYFDNISYLSEEVSDLLCKACTGDGFSKRELYSDDDDIIYSYKRVLGLNGINVPATKPDLLDRSVLIGLAKIDKKSRRKEREMWETFEKIKPELLGAMFSTISKAMVIKKKLKLTEFPRMADFAEWGEAISQALGYKAKSFLTAYYNNIGLQNKEAIEAQLIGPAILKVLEDAEKKTWEGSASELLNILNSKAEELKIDTRQQQWPKGPNAVTRRLNELKSNLDDFGIDLSIERNSKNISKITIQHKKMEAEPPKPPEPPIPTQVKEPDHKGIGGNGHIGDNSLTSYVKEEILEDSEGDA